MRHAETTPGVGRSEVVGWGLGVAGDDGGSCGGLLVVDVVR